LWGRERTVVVTFNPRTARKHEYTLEGKLESLRETLLEFRRKYREKRAHWQDPDAIRERYLRACEKLHIGSQYYHLEFGTREKTPEISFRKDHYQIEKLFRDSKSSDHIHVNPFYHWTDSNIRCQLLTCAIALTVLRLLEITVNGEGLECHSGRRILEDMPISIGLAEHPPNR
jgi:hypothetical protein